MSMTPDKARALLADATPWPWHLQEVKGYPHLRHIATGEGHSGDPTAPVCIPVDVTSKEGAANMALKAAAPEMAATIAGMHTEWGVDVETNTGWCRWVSLDGDTWFATREQAVTAARLEPNPIRIVRRYVTTPEEA